MPKNLLYISTYQFQKSMNNVYAFPSYADQFWGKYLDVFDTITVLGEEIRMEKCERNLSLISDKRIDVQLIPYNARPGMLKADCCVRKALYKFIDKNNYIIIKANYRKGLIAIDICKKLNKTYIVAFSGDMYLDLQSSKNLLKRMYAPIIHKKTLTYIKDAKYGLYVTDRYLQSIYPIEGKQCGCTNTILKGISEEALGHRLKKIEQFNPYNKVIIGLVGTYSDNRKGIDTALRAISLTHKKNIELHILGVGTKKDQNQWYNLAFKLQINKQLYFDVPLKTVDEVLKWNDNIDISILPSRSEGLPRCIIESMSRACPCIISNVCGMSELVDGKWLHEPDDFEKLADLIGKMTNNKENMYIAARQNYERAKYYEYENVRRRRNEFLIDYIKHVGGVYNE